MKTLQKLATSNKTTLPVLKTVKVLGNVATSTDMDMYITEPSTLPDGLYIDTALELKSPLPITDYPELSDKGEIKGRTTITLDALSWLANAMSNEETRYYLCGINFNGTRIAATNGHKLNLLNDAGVDMPNLICPANAVKYAIAITKENKAKQLTIELYEKRILFIVGLTVLETKHVDGTYPEIDRVIPSLSSHVIEYTGNAIKAAMPTIKALNKSKSVAVRLNGKLTYKHVTDNEVTTHSFDGETPFPFDVGFNAHYLADLMPGTMSINDASSPVKVVNGSRLSVLMPIRV